MSKPAGRWAIPISGLLGLGAVGLLAAAAPKLGNAASPLLTSGSATRTAAPVPARPSGATVSAPLAGLAATTTLAGAPGAVLQPGPRVVTILPSQAPVAEQASSVSGATTTPPSPVQRLNLSTAGIADLRRLPQITRGRAYAIVRARPYRSVADLIERKVISTHAYAAIKDKVELR